LVVRAGALLLLWSVCVALPVEAGVKVLLIGSSRHFDEQESGEAKGRTDPEAVASRLQDLLNHGDPKRGSTVAFEDVYRTQVTPVALGSAGKPYPATFHCHSLAQYYFWPEGRDARLKRLRDEPWDYAVLVGDPYLMDRMPGIYAEGVHLLASALRAETPTRLVLMVPWLEDGAAADHLEEVARRVGQGLDIPVAPAGRVAASAMGGDQASSLAAATIFSALGGRRAPGATALASRSLDAVRKLLSKPEITSPYARPTPFTADRLQRSEITFHQTGTSSERGIKGGIFEAAKQAGGTAKEVRQAEQGRIDFNYGRGNSGFEANKRYQVDPGRFHRSYGFPMQEARATAAVSMLYGIDKRYFDGGRYDDGTDLGIAYDMVRDGEVDKNVRAVPIRLMWAKLHELDPSLDPLRDKWHMSHLLDAASGSFIITLLTRKDTRGPEPDDSSGDAWKKWKARAIGYETARRMALDFGAPDLEGKG
jgi:hypothetical protein